MKIREAFNEWEEKNATLNMLLIEQQTLNGRVDNLNERLDRAKKEESSTWNKMQDMRRTPY